MDTTEPKPERIQCGGIAGLPCPAGLTCVDDPSDDCDPEAGGADCIGVCVEPVCDYEDPARFYVSKSPQECALILFQCAESRGAFSDACGCGCELLE